MKDPCLKVQTVIRALFGGRSVELLPEFPPVSWVQADSGKWMLAFEGVRFAGDRPPQEGEGEPVMLGLPELTFAQFCDACEALTDDYIFVLNANMTLQSLNARRN